VKDGQPLSRERPVVRLVQLLQELALSFGIGVLQPVRVFLPPDLGDELEPAVEEPYGGAIVLCDQLSQSLESI
jgi:hypothetical protein